MNVAIQEEEKEGESNKEEAAKVLEVKTRDTMIQSNAEVMIEGGKIAQAETNDYLMATKEGQTY